MVNSKILPTYRNQFNQLSQNFIYGNFNLQMKFVIKKLDLSIK